MIDSYSTQSVRFFAPDVAFTDAAEHLPALLKKFNKPIGDLSPSLYYLRQVIESVDADLYAEFEAEVRTNAKP